MAPPAASDAPDAPETVTDALVLLAAAGYDSDFVIDALIVHCPVCGQVHPIAEALIERVFRFEGPSDPADEAIVFGLRCPRCGGRGSFVSSFGPDADPDILSALTYLAGPPLPPAGS